MRHSLIAHECHDASIFFCDIVGFTARANTISAEDMVAMLNVLFSAFDNISTRHNVYKVETIGDCYLGTCTYERTDTPEWARVSFYLCTLLESA